MLLTLLWIRQYGPSLINFFELFLSSGLLFWCLIVLIWMPFKRHFSISCLDSFLCGVLFYAENFIVILLASRLGFSLGKLEFLTNLETGWVNCRGCTKICYSFLPFFEILMNFTTLNKSFGIFRLHSKAQIESRKRFFIFIEFHLTNSFIQANGRIEGEVKWIELE